ncbi:MAG: 3'-5' exonuclease [Acidobacteriota bacterium]
MDLGPKNPLDLLEEALARSPAGTLPLGEAADLCLRCGPGSPGRRVMAALLRKDGRFRLEEGRVSLRPPPPLPGLPLEEAEVAVLDFETNGLPSPERAIEVGIAVFRAGVEVECFSSLLDPGTPLSLFVARLTGISEADLRGAPAFADLWPRLEGILRGRVLAAHNLPFDGRILALEAERLPAALPPLLGRVCTLRLARRLLPREEAKSLDALAWRFGLSFEARHRALDDARVAGRLLFRLVELAREEREVRSLGDLLALCAPAGKRRMERPGESP